MNSHLRMGALTRHGLAVLLASLSYLSPSAGQKTEESDSELLLRSVRERADKGVIEQQVFLGHMYSGGWGIPQDYAEAARWYRKAADQGNADAQYSLGLLYVKGQGVLQDYAQAHMWINLAASRATGEDQKKFADARDALARAMSVTQIAEAQRLAREWKPKTAQESKTPPSKTPSKK